MDSLNLSESQNNSLNSKNTGSNTSPIACACCGSKYYMQYHPQPYYLRIQHPETTKCKHPQELFEENINNPPSGFPPFPFFHPIFHNSLIPINSCCNHNHSNNAAKNEEKKCGNELESVPNLSNQEKSENNDKTQDPQKYDPGSESPILGHPFNLMDPHFNSFLQPSSWGDFMPWTCNPFFTSMMSYCLFWNSQKFAANASFKNYAGTSSETVCPNNKNTNQTHSSDNKDNKEVGKTDVKSCSVESCLEVEQNENNDQSRENLGEEEETVEWANTNSDSTCEEEGGDAEMEELGTAEEEEEQIVKTSFDSICGGEETEEFGNIEKEEEVVEYAKISCDSTCGEEEDAETEGFHSAVQVESSDYFKMDGKDFLNYKTDSCCSNEPKDNGSDESQPLVESEISDLMARQISENAVDTSVSETQINLSDAWPTDDNVFPYPDNESGKPNLATEIQNYQERMPCKKTFKNFTIADQTNDIFLNEAQISVAAAGDLGGENCVGYKLTIVPFEKDEELVLPEVKPLEFQQKDLELKAPKSPQKNKLSDSVKNSKENSKCVQNSKSKIAKLLNNSKPKESKTDTLKNSRQNPQSYQKEVNSVRGKHNCLFNNNNNSNNNNNNINNINNNNNNVNNKNNNILSANEKTLKFQKTKNCTAVEQQMQGLKKHSKETNLKNQSNKNEKKFRRLKF